MFLSLMLLHPLLLNNRRWILQKQEVTSASDEKEVSVKKSQEPMDRKKCLPAVSTSLALAAGIGIVEAIVLSLGSGSLLDFMGICVVRQTKLIMFTFLTGTLLSSFKWLKLFDR